MDLRWLLAPLRPRPVDWRGRGAPPETERGPVDVIVPVYGAADAVGACLRSVVAHTDLQRHRLVIVLDGVPQPAPEAAIAAALVGAPAPTLLSNPARQGFVVSVNRGMAVSSNDVVLLNSDTLVSAGWLDKLQDAACSSREIASVTPFCNDATICSLPQSLEHNDLPVGHDLESFARLVERASLREYPRLPTGVGVCLYIKRRALQAVGTFSERFGLGYGEENDFCMRALRHGFVHVLDDATFILHAGHASFGHSSAGLMRRARRLLTRRHPAYFATVAAFLRQDPLAPARLRVRAALRPPPGRQRPPARVLHVVHGWPPEANGGTESYARGLALQQALQRDVTVYARLACPEQAQGAVRERHDSGVRVRLRVNNFVQRDPLSRNAMRDRALERDFAHLLDDARPALVHVHHLAGLAASLPLLAATRGIPVLFQAQDWWGACARVNLLLPDRGLCSGPTLARCAACQPLTRVWPDAIWNRLLHGYRRRLLRRAVRSAGHVVMGSHFIERSLRDMGLIAARQKTHVIPYGVALGDMAQPRRPAPGAPLRFGYLGSLLPHKGVHVAVAAFAGADPEHARLTVFGDASIDPAYARELHTLASSAVSFAGSFAESAKASVLQGLDVLIVPSLGLESFGLAAREAMACGVPVLASRRGALIEIFEQGGAGATFTPGSVTELRALITRLVDEPRLLAQWTAALPSVKGMAAHAEEIEAVYAQVLAERAS